MPITPVRVFVSYAHADSRLQAIFAERLKAAETQGAFEYWADEKIAKGAAWDPAIQAELQKADVALLLVSNAFLGSNYCRQEMLSLLRKPQLFWVIVDDCVWRSSPLAGWQSCATLLGMTKKQIEQAATRVVDQIVQSAGRITQQRSPSETFLRQSVGLEAAHQFRDLEALPGGRHCWAQRATARFEGHENDERVVIKVLLKNPSEDLAPSIQAAVDIAGKLRHGAFIRLRRHYLEGLPALVLESVDQRMLRDHLQPETPFSSDQVRDHLITLAEAFDELHERGGTYGMLTSHNLFIDANTQRLRFSAISITGQLSQIHQGWQRFIGDDPASAPYLIPEQFENDPWSPRSDQFVIGQLAVEMLTGSPLPQVQTPDDLTRRYRFFEDPLASVSPRIRYHKEFAATLTQLLQRDPANRFETMRDVVTQLEGLDDEDVALARHAYLAACEQPDFFDEFYARLFAVCPGAQKAFVDAHKGEDPPQMAGQAEKLRIALNSALVSPKSLRNSLGQYVKKHRSVPPDFFPAFTDTFVATLASRPGLDLPPFVLDAVRIVLGRAATHLSPGAAGRDVEAVK